MTSWSDIAAAEPEFMAVVTDQAELDAWVAAYPRPRPPGAFELFRVDVRDVVTVGMGEPADHLLIEHWHEGRGLTRTKRA